MSGVNATETEGALRRWLERELGGTVTGLTREERWRPSWVATLERANEQLSLYVRGDRGHGYSYPVAYEARVLEVLERNGIPVPHVYGVCEQPPAIVMDRVEGVGQLTGIDDPAQQRSIVDQYVDILAAIHAIDVQQFEDVGVRNPPHVCDLQLSFHRDRRRIYREQLKSRPEPFITFVEGWLDRNVPEHRSARSFVTFDAGQFLVRDGRVAALYDFEIAHINDPLADLAGLRVRNSFEPVGDLGYLYRRYQTVTGERLDLDVINFHTVVLALAANQAIAKLITQPLPDAINWRVWEVTGARMCVSAIAETIGAELPEIEVVAPAARATSVAVEAMAAAVDSIVTDDSYQHRMASSLARHLALVDRFGPEFEQLDLDDVAPVLGHRPGSTTQADAMLEQFVAAAGPELDETLLRLFHRRIERKRLLLPEFDAAGAAAGDISPHIDRSRLAPLRAVIEEPARP